MKMLVINGSPRPNGNTSELAKQFLKSIGDRAVIDEVRLFNMNIKGCMNCGACQRAVLETHCAINDDMRALYDSFLSSDTIMIASPIYMWQFTPCTLAFLNRLHCLCRSADFSYNAMEGKRMAALITLGAEGEVADFAANGLRDLCEFFKMDYRGDLRIPFANSEKERLADGTYEEKLKEFAAKVLK